MPRPGLPDVTAPAHAVHRTEGAWSVPARAMLSAVDADLSARFDAGESVLALVAARADAVDTLIRAAWVHCVGEVAPAALFAVGGYGRGELFPQSDIDLLVLADETAQGELQGTLGCFFALLWDAGLPASHAVRSAAQCTAAAAADQTVLTALIESRPLHAAPAACVALADAVDTGRTWPARDYFGAKVEERRARHARYGDTADNLEPNIKDGPGGLRDLQMLGWMALRSFGVRDLDALVGLGHLGADEAVALAREREALSQLRFGLHLVAGRADDRLRFDHQKALARRLGFADRTDALGVETMMQGFYRSAAVVLRINERLQQRFEEHFDGAAVAVPIDDRFELRRGYLAARAPAWPDTGTIDVFALFAAWAAHPDVRGLHSQTARALAEALPDIAPYDTAAPEARAAFMALLRGRDAVATMERMARLGVLARWLPAFAQVSGRMQFDLFHVYTVDQHTMAVLRNLAAFASGQADPRFAVAHEVWPGLRKPELLLLAALFHDIAKGRGGDHSELGAEDARAFCTAHALGEGDTAQVEWLVRRHLLMSLTSQKQDIADPAVIHRFATEVADRERLDYLYLLTCADIAGTSPRLWNAWKDRLLVDLRNATRLALRRGLENPVAADERIAETRSAVEHLLAREGVEPAESAALLARFPRYSFLRARPDPIAWQAMALRDGGDGAIARVRQAAEGSHALEVFVHAPDRLGLFAAIVITLDRLGLAIQQARALDGPGSTIFDSFQVLPMDPRQPPEPQAVARKLAAVLNGSLERVRPAQRGQPRHLRHFRVSPEIVFEDAADGSATVLSLVCTDRPGLLAAIAEVLRGQRLRVHDARVATFGARAEDVFRVSDGDLALDESRRDALCAALLDKLDGERT